MPSLFFSRPELLLLWCLGLSLLTFLLMGEDKARAKHRGAYRIPERTFFLLALAGGSPGAVLGMFLFRHKTRHPAFRIGLPAILLVQAILIFFLLSA